MTVYIRVPEIERRLCTGCEANNEASRRTCYKLAQSLNGTEFANCTGVIWIEDHEAARLAYITMKLEK